jgi:hypothetical protein
MTQKRTKMTVPNRCSTRLTLLCGMLTLGVAFLPAEQAGTPRPDAVPAEDSGTPVIRAKVHLVLVDVIARNSKTGLPANTLGRESFRIFEDQHEVAITAFDSGAAYATRPIALWFVVICNEPSKSQYGYHAELASGRFAGKEMLLRPALDDLDKRDRVGVAHWCDNGEAQLDLLPTEAKDVAISKLAEVLKPDSARVYSTDPNRTGELTLQKLMRFIVEDAHQRNPQPLPAIVFLHTDQTGMPHDELDRVASTLLETSGIVFGIKDANVAEPFTGRFRDGEQAGVLHYLSGTTGGQYFSVKPELYAKALQSILLQLHFRYELAFKPPAVDRKMHKLRVELVGETKKEHDSVQLSYRYAYIAKP